MQFTSFLKAKDSYAPIPFLQNGEVKYQIKMGKKALFLANPSKIVFNASKKSLKTSFLGELTLTCQFPVPLAHNIVLDAFLGLSQQNEDFDIEAIEIRIVDNNTLSIIVRVISTAITEVEINECINNVNKTFEKIVYCKIQKVKWYTEDLMVAYMCDLPDNFMHPKNIEFEDINISARERRNSPYLDDSIQIAELKRKEEEKRRLIEEENRKKQELIEQEQLRIKLEEEKKQQAIRKERKRKRNILICNLLSVGLICVLIGLAILGI